jgi:hypothetical protein
MLSKYLKLKVVKPTSTRSCTFVSSTGLARSHGDSEDRVCAQAALVLSSVELQHQVVDGSLQTKQLYNTDCFSLQKRNIGCYSLYDYFKIILGDGSRVNHLFGEWISIGMISKSTITTRPL